jgi:predicted negative regulator of RcsB-dependent stress response
VARLRLAALQAEAKQPDEALKTLDAAKADGAASFTALVADRRGDVLMLQGKKAEAAAAWQAAYAAMSDKVEYRRLVEAKLVSIGAAPGAAAQGTTAAASAAGSTASAAAASAPAPGASK